jgi:hypothetical protein
MKLNNMVYCKNYKIMKNTYRNLLLAACSAALITGCAKNANLSDSVSLKQAIDQDAARLNTAMTSITSSPAFNILTMKPDAMARSAEADASYKVYITLDTIKGKYEYNKVNSLNNWGLSLIHFFTKTAEYNQMIVNMPLQKVTRPWSLRHFSKADSSLTNNFSIKVSGYHNNYNSYWDYDYLLNSEISIDEKVEGKLNIDALIKMGSASHYKSSYEFTDGYTAEYNYQYGDTTVSSFSIKDKDRILYSEDLLGIKSDTLKYGREHQYKLTIGDVQIVRKSGTKQVQVFVKGVAQPGAVVEVIDKVYDPEASVCKKRDVQITFEDGTVTTVSALIGQSVNDIRSLYTSLHQVYFAAYIVDWIAYDINYQR